METPLDRVFLIVMILNVSVVSSLIVVDFILSWERRLLKRREKRVKRLTGRYRPRIEDGKILKDDKINKHISAKVNRELVGLFRKGRYLNGALPGKRGDKLREICYQLDIYLYYISALKSRRKRPRAKACYTLGLLKDPRATEALVILLNDRSPEVRSAAAQAIGSMGEETSLMPLTLLLDDEDKWVVTTSLDALSLLSYGYAEMLVHFLKHRNHEVRSSIALILGQVGSTELAPNLLEALVDEKDTSVKMELIRSLGELEDNGSTETLIDLTNSEDVDISIEAVRSLGRIADDRAADPLIKLLADKRWDLRREVIAALKKLDLTGLINTLIEVIEEADESLVSGILELAEGLKDDKLVGTLIKLLESPNPEIVSGAVEALGGQMDTRATLPLIYILKSSSHWFLRARAAKALGKIGDVRALGSLQETSTDNNLWVSRRSAEALESLQAGSD